MSQPLETDIGLSLCVNPRIQTSPGTPSKIDAIVRYILLLNVQNRGDNLIKLLKRQINHVTELCTSLKPNNNNNIRIKPKVLHIEWLDPLMGSGYWITERVEACQCEMLMGEKGGHSPILGYGIKSIELLSNINPDHIIIAPCGFSIERTYVEMQNLNQIFNSNGE